MSRLPNCLSATSLKNIWRNSRDGRADGGSPGIDWMRASDFSKNLDRKISELREEIRTGKFRFRNLRVAPIPKNSGGYRIIAIPTVRDRLLQRALLHHLETDKRFLVNSRSDISFGFSKSRTLQDAQCLARDMRLTKPWVLQADIIKFFDNIPRADVKTLIRTKVRSKVVSQLLCAAVDCELHDKDAPDLAELKEIKKGRGLRQGMPISPVLSNLLLKKFDDAVIDKGITAIRYADDLAIFGPSRAQCEFALEEIHRLLDKLQLKIPEISEETKTKILSPHEPVEFLGVEVRRHGDVYKLHAPSKKLSKIEEKMKELASVDRCIEKKWTLGLVDRALDSFVVGHIASMRVLDNHEEFSVRLEALKKKAMRTLLVELIGSAAAARLSDDKQAILGLIEFDKSNPHGRRR